MKVRLSQQHEIPPVLSIGSRKQTMRSSSKNSAKSAYEDPGKLDTPFRKAKTQINKPKTYKKKELERKKD